MIKQFKRRDVLRAGVGAAVGLSLIGCATSGARSPAAARVSTTPLGERLLLRSGLGANRFALRGEEGLLLVETGAPDASGRLQQQLTKFAGAATVTTVINTHWQEANTGGNDVFGAAGAKIIAHAKTAQRLAVPQYVPWEDRYLPARAKVAVPREVFYYGSKELTFGGERIEYGYLQQAHTDGDLYVWFKDSNVLAVGDVVAPVSDPQICWYEGGWVGGRVDSQAKLLTLGDEQTKIVASTGGVISRAQVQIEMDAMTQVFDRVSDAMRKGMTTEDMQQGKLLDGLARTWADPDKALYDAHKSMWAHYNKLSHTIV
jgi:glyoxylase-like metal-dependent hydrolase (beta-lactamase superfamily II)